jgi:hypothetical protein
LTDFQHTCGVSDAAAVGHHLKDFILSLLESAEVLEAALKKLVATFTDPPLGSIGAVTIFAKVITAAKGT